MKIRSLVLGVLLLLVVGAPSVAAQPIDTKIIGGETVTESRWVAGIYYDDEFFCSASIIAPRWALTAQHCVFGSGPEYIRVGSVNAGEGTRADVVNIHNSDSADIALLELASDVEAEYAKLADSDPEPGETHHIYGWGTYEVGEDKPTSPVLKRAAVNVTGMVDGLVESTWNSGTAGYGDSGGPQMTDDGVQVGWIQQVSGV